jgi:hypothetical protein
MDAQGWMGSLLILACVLIGSWQHEPLTTMDSLEMKSVPVK